MKEFYQQQLKVAKQQYDLATLGCLTRAQDAIAEANGIANSENGLTLEDVCKLADELNHMLEAVCSLQKYIENTEAELKKLEEKKPEVKDA